MHRLAMQRLRAEQAKLEQENTDLSGKLLAQQAFRPAESLGTFAGTLLHSETSAMTLRAADATPIGRLTIRKSHVCIDQPFRPSDTAQDMDGHLDKIYAMDWSPDSQHIVTAAQDGKLLVYDAYTACKTHRVDLENRWVLAAAFSPQPGTRQYDASSLPFSCCVMWLCLVPLSCTPRLSELTMARYRGVGRAGQPRVDLRPERRGRDRHPEA
jgi:hypothetical protein